MHLGPPFEGSIRSEKVFTFNVRKKQKKKQIKASTCEPDLKPIQPDRFVLQPINLTQNFEVWVDISKLKNKWVKFMLGAKPGGPMLQCISEQIFEASGL